MSGVERSITDAKTQAEPAMAVVAISMSAGGLAPLREVIRGLRVGFPASVVIAPHVHGRTFLPEILSRDTPLSIRLACSGALLRAGEISVCPAQEHVVINPDATISVSQRRRVRSFRPSANWMFESAAASFRERAFAVVLSGFQNDGADGVVAIRRAGGTVIVQHPDACEHPDMPRAAIATGAVNFILDPDQIPVVLTTLLNDVDLQQCRLEWESPFRCGIETSPLPAA